MEWTIDKAIEGLRAIQEYYNDGTGDIYLGFGKADNENVDFAIDTMRKYQTMQEVLEKVWHVPSCMLDEAECLNKIMETYRTVR